MKNKILITAVPRSGTGYISKLLTSCGIDAPHEVIGLDGIVSWRGIIENINDCNIIVHQVRNPLKVISSLTIIMPQSWKFIFDNLNLPMPKDLIYRSMITYYYWNKLIENKKPIHRYKIEEIDVNIPYLFGLFNKEMCIIPEIEKDYNTKYSHRKKYVDYKLMKSIDADLAQKILEISTNYNYFIK